MVDRIRDPVQLAYDALAAYYDDFTETLNYEPWLAETLPRLEHWGLAGKRLLDVGCGTGKSLIPMLERGWRCSGCDISPAMVRVARKKVGDRAQLTVADMRHLPRLGSFDLVWSLNDSINYLLDLSQLELALCAMRENMADAGLLVFDVNTLLTYRTFFAERRVVERDGRRLAWHGEASRDQAPGSIATACFEIEADTAGVHVHQQRHFPEGKVRDALDMAGLETLDVLGQDEDAGLHRPLRELDHVKALYIARGRGPRA
ncbi:MAG TPA: class I SAM-dependent methyltransferase [Solirubrobacterales bacterium]|jgi:predicted TPR repeat methyltransferase|nr:class I SAM-dependent methyltransferase [Solirubrobacterales bacterium]